MKVVSLFSGIGSLDKACEKVGFETIWANDCDPYVFQVYRANHNSYMDTRKLEDIPVEDIPAHDILVSSPPCQAFSKAGSRKGFDDTDKGQVFLETFRVVNYHRPRVLIIENVPHLKTHDKGNTYKVISEYLDELGYFHKDQILGTHLLTNIPHYRRRIFIVAFRDKEDFERYKPFTDKDEVPLERGFRDFLDSTVPNKYYYTKGSHKVSEKILEEVVKYDTVYQYRRTVVRENKRKLVPTLTANMGTGGHNVPIVRVEDGVRKFTPEECFRFQGIYGLDTAGVADSRLYTMAGNTITYPLAVLLAERVSDALTPRNTSL